MKRTVFFALSLVAGLAFAASASADNSQNNNDNRSGKFGKVGSIFELVEELKKRHEDKEENDKPVPIDPGMGNGKPTADPVTPPSRPGYVWVGDHWEREKAPVKQPLTPPSRPGFVWVGDHWEREKATSNSPTNTTVITDPVPGTIVVRDHRTPAVDSNNASGGVTVTSSPVIRDHRTPKTSGVWSTSGAVVRDHRRPSVDTSSAPGGVVVTSTPRPKKKSGGVLDTLEDAASNVGKVVGNAGSTVGNAVISAGNSVGVGHGTIKPAGSSKPNWKPVAGTSATVRDHR